MKKSDMDSKKKEMEEIILSASPEKLEKIQFVLEYVTNATPAEMVDLKEKMKRKDFITDDWIKSQKSIMANNAGDSE